MTWRREEVAVAQAVEVDEVVGVVVALQVGHPTQELAARMIPLLLLVPSF